jgi:uncharacterized membrane protein YfcA
MPVVTPALALVVFLAGAGAGVSGAALGIGGAVFLVPLLNLALGFPIAAAAAISLTTVIATSSNVTARRAGGHLLNIRLGMALEAATAAGSLLGGITAHFPPHDSEDLRGGDSGRGRRDADARGTPQRHRRSLGRAGGPRRPLSRR